MLGKEIYILKQLNNLITRRKKMVIFFTLHHPPSTFSPSTLSWEVHGASPPPPGKWAVMSGKGQGSLDVGGWSVFSASSQVSGPLSGVTQIRHILLLQLLHHKPRLWHPHWENSSEVEGVYNVLKAQYKVPASSSVPWISHQGTLLGRK